MLVRYPAWAEGNPALSAYGRLLENLAECQFLEKSLSSIPEGPYYLVATGKASLTMAKALIARRGAPVAGLIIGKSVTDLSLPTEVQIISGGHPIPNSRSLIAGEKLVAFCREIPQGALVIYLLSGGSSALVEHLSDGITLPDVQRETNARMRLGDTIAELNEYRKSVSQIKGGKLASNLVGCDVRVLVLSDVEGDDLSVIGSGPLYPYFPHSIVANQSYAASFITNILEGIGLRVIVGPSLTGFLPEIAERYAALIKTVPKGSVILGTGESTMEITGTGIGGRCQHFALCSAIALESTTGISLLAGSTDGTDGPTDYAGAIIDGETTARADGLDPRKYLANFNSTAYLTQANSLIVSGASQSNINDVVIAVHL